MREYYMRGVVRQIADALGLEQPERSGAVMESLRARKRADAASAQLRDLRSAIEDACAPGLREYGSIQRQYGLIGGPRDVRFWRARKGEGLVGAYLAIASIGWAQGFAANPDERSLHIQVLSADPWTGEDVTAEFSGTVADLR